MKNLFSLIILFLTIGIFNPVFSQYWDPEDGCLKESKDGPCLSNTLVSAVPFLRINPDARSGAMGDVGIAISADPNAMSFNASKLAFTTNDLGISATYSPWLKSIGLQDVYLAYLTGYKRIDDVQALGFGLRFFSLGQIDFRDTNGMFTGSGKPREFALSFAYSRKLAENFSAALTAKYIYSDLASGQQIENIDITAANAFAADLSFTYFHDIALGGYDATLNYGAALTNLGSKVTYLKSKDIRDPLPSNLGLGVSLDMNIDDYNLITVSMDVNKLLVPTPVSILDTANYDIDPVDGKPDYRQRNLIQGITGSFTDAPGGFAEEFREMYFSFGAEYWYDQQFAVRAGYYYEHPLKGDRQFLTVGIGLKYNTLNMNFSYLVPTTIQRSPLDNTLRFGVIFNLGELEE